MYTVNNDTPVRECFRSIDGVGTIPDSRWGVLDENNAYVFYSYCRQNPIVLRSTSTLADPNPKFNPNPNPIPNLNPNPNINPNPNLNPKPVVTIIFDGKLWSCKQAYRYESLERTPIWEYPKIGPWFEIMTSVDADLRSGRRLETGRRSESIIYIIS